jgi:predicted transcriptional regulator of viral defense system
VSNPTRIPSGRQQLTALARAAGDIIRLDDAQATLGLTRTAAAKRLARWAEQGWLRRVGRGAYVRVPLDSLQSEVVLDDPWLLVPVLFAPAYVGGRTAAEHWDLTEQIFRDILVLTARPVRRRSHESQGVTFTLKHIDEGRLFGTRVVWRGRSRVEVSDVHRTIVDMLDDPALGAGIQHVADCLATYLARPDRDLDRLLEYASHLGNGAVYKRLGYLAERLSADTSLLDTCRERLTAGDAKLDPALDCERLVTRWKLRVPEAWARSAAP